MLARICVILFLACVAALVGLREESQAQVTKEELSQDLPGDWEKYIGHYEFAETLDDIEFDKMKKEPEHFTETITATIVIPCAKPPGNASPRCIYLPDGTKLVKFFAWMRNASWAPGGQKCRSDLGDTSWRLCPLDGRDCPIGWSKALPIRVNDKQVCVQFWNWRDDNHRQGAVRVYFRR